MLSNLGTPLEVSFCKRCTMSNQRPSSSVEFLNYQNSTKTTIGFDDEGICSACRFSEKKKSIDWCGREKQLIELCDRFRRGDGRYDVIVPGSGGKDSVMAAHLLKHKYGMTPLTVTWPPALYTDVGRSNFLNWLDIGLTNITYTQNRKLHRLLTKFAFQRLLHPFQPFILGQKNLAPKLSVLMDIPLVMYGENEAEYGNSTVENDVSTRGTQYFTFDGPLKSLVLGGATIEELREDHGFSVADLESYVPAKSEDIERVGTEVHYLGYFIRWHPQDTYYYSVENADFYPNDQRTEGSYSKYSSLDDKIDWLHYYTTHIKFGIGRATYDSAQEIRNEDITRYEGIRLVERFDGEFPYQYLGDCLSYMRLTEEEFSEIVDNFRPSHLWEKKYGKWKLRKAIWMSGQ